MYLYFSFFKQKMSNGILKNNNILIMMMTHIVDYNQEEIMKINLVLDNLTRQLIIEQQPIQVLLDKNLEISRSFNLTGILSRKVFYPLLQNASFYQRNSKKRTSQFYFYKNKKKWKLMSLLILLSLKTFYHHKTN